MPETVYDIGNLRDRPECLYDLWTFLLTCDDSFIWDRDSECYKVFRTVVDSLCDALPSVITIDLRDPDEVSKT